MKDLDESLACTSFSAMEDDISGVVGHVWTVFFLGFLQLFNGFQMLVSFAGYARLNRASVIVHSSVYS